MASRANAIVLILSIGIIVANCISLTPFNNKTRSVLGFHKDSLLNFTELSSKYGFTSEEHIVKTEDDYILSIFRMRRKTCDQFKKPPVLMMHGLFQSSAAWLDAGPNAGLAYLIADECHDVWVGNQRGNYYSRRHIRLDPDKDREFWKFSVDEIGKYDLPATVDYVLKITGEEKLNYIGFSQGGGTFFVMCSESPEHCDKVNIMIALAPAARITNTKSVTLKQTIESVSTLEGVLNATGFYEFFAKGELTQGALDFFCKFRLASDAICGSTAGFLDPFHPGSIATETLQVMSSHTPAGTSTHNLARYGQIFKMNRFQKFDYGKERNIEIYGTEQQPSYNLAAVTAPVVVLYGKNDYFVDIKDLSWLVEKMPNVLEFKEIADPLWTHFDMVYSQHIKNMVFPIINHYLLEYSKNEIGNNNSTTVPSSSHLN